MDAGEAAPVAHLAQEDAAIIVLHGQIVVEGVEIRIVQNRDAWIFEQRLVDGLVIADVVAHLVEAHVEALFQRAAKRVDGPNFEIILRIDLGRIVNEEDDLGQPGQMGQQLGAVAGDAALLRRQW